MPEIMDMTVVSCDGRHALVDFDVWSKLNKVVVIRAEYKLGDEALSIVCHEDDYDLAAEVITCPDCLADVKEAVLYQRDLNRNKN